MEEITRNQVAVDTTVELADTEQMVTEESLVVLEVVALLI